MGKINMGGSTLHKRILVAPLDWGLGHATRCIPVIRKLLDKNAEVVLAGDGNIRNLLSQEFPTLQFLDLKGYRVRYAQHPALLPLQMAAQIPKILRAIEYEHNWLEKQLKKHQFTAIISDNRYGLNHPTVPSVFITHQLNIRAPLFQNILQQINYTFINQFSRCWVPDFAEEDNLAAALSHPKELPDIPVTYVGPLSRFAPADQPVPSKELLIILSGPEPQRTAFEELVVNQLSKYAHPVVMVRGLPGTVSRLPVNDNVTVHNHLPADELRSMMLRAKVIVCRSGYSTLMDIAALPKKAVLVATPGQTEQEYLAKYWMKKNYALAVPQYKFKLGSALDLAASFPFVLPPHSGSDSLLNAAVDELLR